MVKGKEFKLIKMLLEASMIKNMRDVLGPTGCENNPIQMEIQEKNNSLFCQSLSSLILNASVRKKEL